MQWDNTDFLIKIVIENRQDHFIYWLNNEGSLGKM